MIVVLKVTTLLLLRISLKPSSYGKVDEATVTSLKKRIWLKILVISPHKESAATIHAATEALKSNKKTTLQAFDRLTCPTATDAYIHRAEHKSSYSTVCSARLFFTMFCHHVAGVLIFIPLCTHIRRQTYCLLLPPRRQLT